MSYDRVDAVMKYLHMTPAKFLLNKRHKASDVINKISQTHHMNISGRRRTSGS